MLKSIFSCTADTLIKRYTHIHEQEMKIECNGNGNCIQLQSSNVNRPSIR